VKTLEQIWIEVSLNPVLFVSVAHVSLNNMLNISNSTVQALDFQDFFPDSVKPNVEFVYTDVKRPARDPLLNPRGIVFFPFLLKKKKQKPNVQNA